MPVRCGGDRDRDPDARRPRARLAGDAHDPAHRLTEDVVSGQIFVRAVRAEPADRREDEPRVPLAQHVLVGEAPLLERPGLEVLHHDVGIVDEAEGDIAAGRL